MHFRVTLLAIASMMLLTAVIGDVALCDSAADLDQARLLIDDKQYAQAIRLLEQIVKDQGFAAKANSLLGECYSQQGKLDDAIRALNTGIASARLPNDQMVLPEIRCRLANAYIAAGFVPQAAALVDVIRNDYADTTPALVEVRYGLAKAYISSGSLQQAEPLIEAVRAASPGDGLLLDFFFYRQQNQLDLATKAFLDYAAAFPAGDKSCKTYLEVGELLMKQRRFDEGRALLDRLYEQQPRWRGTALFEKAAMTQTYERDYTAAIGFYRQMLNEAPKDPQANKAKSGLGQLVLAHLRSPADARAILTELSTAKGLPSGQVRFYLGLCSYQEEDWARAQSEFQELCDSCPSSPYCSAARELGAACTKNASNAVSPASTSGITGGQK
jgi:tetratricopeptide (TPR) repeat protein